MHLNEYKNTKFFYGYIVVVAAFSVMAVMIGAMYTFGVFFKPVLIEHGWTRAAISGAYSLCLLVQGSLCILMGRLTDRFGPRVVITVCGLLAGLGYILMSQISDIWHLYLFYGIVGLGVSGGFVPPASTVARWFAKRRGLTTGIAVSGIGIGILIMPPIANWLIASYGWRNSYIAIGILVIIFVVLSAQFLKREPSQIGLQPCGRNESKIDSSNLIRRELSFRRVIKTNQFWMVGLMFVCFGFCLQTILVHMVPYAIDTGISAANSAFILAIIGGVSVVSRIVLGNIGDKIGNKFTFTICFTIMFFAFLSILATNELWAFYLCAVTFGFAYGGVVALLSPILAELFGLGALGVILGAITFYWTIGETIGSVLVGKIFDTMGSYQLAFLICIVLNIMAIIFTSFLRPIVAKEH